MRKIIGGALLAAALLPGVATAQHEMAAKHEFGIDAVFLYRKPSGGTGRWVFGAPSDIRIGFVNTKKVMFEAGFQFAFDGGGGVSNHYVALGVSAQWSKDHRKGLFVQAGPAIELIGGTGSPSGTSFSATGDIGTRVPYGSGAFRLSTGVRYSVKNTTLGTPSAVNVHVGVGLSLWH